MPAPSPAVHVPPEPGATRRRWLQSLGGAIVGVALPARSLDQASGSVVLTVGGRVRNTNDGRRAQFDMAMLEALPQQTLVTRTPWYAQARSFTGPLLRDVLTAAGAQGTTLRLMALNDYQVDMPYEDAQRHDVLLARLLDGKPMTVRDKGPLFVIYPFDAQPELRSAVYYGRSAWQLRTIEVL
jgi:hypothetical protein